MSAYLLSTEFYQALANELASRAEYSNKEVDTDYNVAVAVRQFMGYGASAFDAPVDAWASAAGQAAALYIWNAAGVDAEYPPHDPVRIAPLTLQRRFYSPEWTPVQTIKHLQCLYHQCCAALDDEFRHHEPRLTMVRPQSVLPRPRRCLFAFAIYTLRRWLDRKGEWNYFDRLKEKEETERNEELWRYRVGH